MNLLHLVIDQCSKCNHSHDFSIQLLASVKSSVLCSPVIYWANVIHFGGLEHFNINMCDEGPLTIISLSH